MRANHQKERLCSFKIGHFVGLHFTRLAYSQDILLISIFWRGFSKSELFASEIPIVQFLFAKLQ